jgi:CIC family chloride channel protein
MLIAGAAAGIGSIFRSPLGGALFAVEVMYREPEFESEGVIPAIISSIVGYSVFASFHGWTSIFETPPFAFQKPTELFFYAALGLICAIIGIFYIKFFYWLHKIFKYLSIPNHFKPALGGLLLGILAIFIPQVWGGGYGWIQLAIFGKLGIGLMISIALAKIVATSFTISSGGSGGVFAPSLMIGAMIGGAFGQISYTLFPTIISEPATFVLVGMGGFFAGVAKVPIASLIMVCEMGRSYGLLAPLMMVSAIAYLIIPRSLSIYQNQVENRVDSPAHRGDFIIDILEQLKVKDALTAKNEVLTIDEKMPLRQILNLVTETTYSYFPVLNEDGEFKGIIPMDSIRSILLEEGVLDLINASDLAITTILTVSLDEDLNSVLKKLTINNMNIIPVVENDNPRKVIAMLSRGELLTAYDKEIKKVRSSE